MDDDETVVQVVVFLQVEGDPNPIFNRDIGRVFDGVVFLDIVQHADPILRNAVETVRCKHMLHVYDVWSTVIGWLRIRPQHTLLFLPSEPFISLQYHSRDCRLNDIEEHSLLLPDAAITRFAKQLNN